MSAAFYGKFEQRITMYIDVLFPNFWITNYARRSCMMLTRFSSLLVVILETIKPVRKRSTWCSNNCLTIKTFLCYSWLRFQSTIFDFRRKHYIWLLIFMCFLISLCLAFFLIYIVIYLVFIAVFLSCWDSWKRLK